MMYKPIVCLLLFSFWIEVGLAEDGLSDDLYHVDPANFFTKTHEIHDPRAVPSDLSEGDNDGLEGTATMSILYDGWEAPQAIAAIRLDEDTEDDDSDSGESQSNVFRHRRDVIAMDIKIEKATIQRLIVENGIILEEGPEEQIMVEAFQRSPPDGKPEDKNPKNDDNSKPKNGNNKKKNKNKLRHLQQSRQLPIGELRTVEELGNIATGPRREYRINITVNKIWIPCWWTYLHIRLLMPSYDGVWIALPWLPYTRYCRNCYSYANQLMAQHGQTLPNCGGRTCSCYDGRLTCDAKCKSRRAWHTLSAVDKQKHVNAINWLETQQSNPLGFSLGTATPRNYFGILQDHLTYSGHAHGNSKFLPWHRCYLCEYEQLLQLYDVCLTVPFWYHPVDSAPNPLQYHTLDDTYLGDAISWYGLLNNPWDLPASFSPFSRGGSNSNPSLATSSDIASLLTAASFGTYRGTAEGWLHHGSPHVYVGGNMGGYESPADPLFFLHHCIVDRNWNVWRGLSPTNAASYDNSLAASVSLQWNIQVSNVISETGLFAPSVTIYTGAGQLPTGDHCAPCYRRIYSIIDWIGVPLDPALRPLVFDHTGLEAALAQRFTPEELQTRSADDPTLQQLMRANNVGEETLVAMARKDCFSLILPDTVKQFVFRFNMDDTLVQKELCERVLRRVVDRPIIVKTLNGENGNDDDSNTTFCSVRV